MVLITIKMKKRDAKSGFTMVELLVTMAVITILSTIAVINFTGAKAKSRDAKRKTDLTKIAVGLDSYKIMNHKYPTSTTVSAGTLVKVSENWFDDAMTTGGFVDAVPNDPKFDNDPTSQYGYSFAVDGAAYVLLTKYEKPLASDTAKIGTCSTWFTAPLTLYNLAITGGCN